MTTKKKIVDLTGGQLVSVGTLRPVKGVTPVGNQVLVERMTEQELNPTTLHISTNDRPSNQGYVLAVGPQVNKDYGIKVGDRVLLQGSFVPVPKFDENPRELNLLLPDMIKAILVD